MPAAFRCRGDFRNVRDLRRRIFHQTRDVVENVLHGEPGDKTLAPHLGGQCRAPFFARDHGQIAFIAKQAVNYQHARLVDALLYGLVAAKSLLGKGEWNQFLAHLFEKGVVVVISV